MCNNCDGEAKKEGIRLDRRKKTKVAAGESGILPSSTTKFSTLSTSEMAKRYQLSQNRNKANKRTIKNYKLCLEEIKEEQSISFHKSQIPAVLERVLSYMDEKTNKETMENKILDILMKSKMAKEKYGLHETELKIYATRVSKMMGDECKKSRVKIGQLDLIQE